MNDAVTAWRGWGLAAYGAALVLAAMIAYFLLGLPLQVSDNVMNLIIVHHKSYAQLLHENGGARSMLWITLKLAAVASGGHYFGTFRAIQIVQVALLLVLVVRVLRVRTANHAAAAVVSLVVLLGLHTFTMLVREGYPINTKLSLLVYFAVAMNLLVARPRWYVDVGASLLLALAAMTLETGVLIWVLFVAGYVVGFRGVSRRGVIGATVITLAFLVVRAPTNGGPAALTNAPTGYGMQVLEPQEVVARFGSNPWPFYASNVATSVLTVLFAEPRRGAFTFTASVLAGDWRRGAAIAVATTAATSLLIFVVAARRLRAWLHGDLPAPERWIPIFVSVLVANACVSFAYTKDEIMSPAGLLYAVAAYAALVMVADAAAAWRPVKSAALALVLLLIGCGWCIRTMDVAYILEQTAVLNRVDWARVDDWERANDVNRTYPDAAPMIAAMQRDALGMAVAHPFQSEWFRWWERWYSFQ